MGIYDRDYERGQQSSYGGFHVSGPSTVTTKLIIVMLAVYVVQLFTARQFPDVGWFTDLFSLRADVVVHPWRFFEFLSYGFLHSVWDVKHIIFNAITFWFFGRSVEYHYGKREYLAFFLTAIVVAGVVWVAGVYLVNRQWVPSQMLGASGGIAGVLLLFCLNFPHQLIYIWGVLPIPAWIFAIVFIAIDLFGASGHSLSGNTQIAFTAHLGGALFALVYFKAGWRLENWIPSGSSLKRLKPRPRLRVVEPDEVDDPTEAEVDRILKKIQDHGRDSLTRRELRILEDASREYQKRRR